MSDDFQNKNLQNLNQSNPQNQKVKLRLRLKSGEEFEAEGSLPFVLAQKNEFLTNNAPYFKENATSLPYTQQNAENATIPNFAQQNSIPNPQANQQNNNTDIQPNQVNAQNITENTSQDATLPTQDEQPNSQPMPPQKHTPTHRIVNPAEYNLHVPAIRRRQPQNNLQEEMLPLELENSTAETTAPQTFENSTSQTFETKWQIDEKIWSKIAYLDGTDLVLRRKVKDLKPNLAALITLAAAKMLGGMTKMSALELSKSLRLSGYIKEGERLDRVLAAEIKAGTVFFEGSKRNRGYIISQTGTAKAYNAAEHFLLS